jgi:hypothetical protein
MTPFDEHGPFDELDARALAEVRELWTMRDPMPPELIDHVLFAIDLDGIDVEVLRLRELNQLAAARGNGHGRMVTLEGRGLTVMLTIAGNPDGTSRVDGWLAPAASHPIELRGITGSVSTVADVRGRFSLNPVPPGSTQVVISLGADGHRAVGPAFEV